MRAAMSKLFREEPTRARRQLRAIYELLEQLTWCKHAAAEVQALALR